MGELRRHGRVLFVLGLAVAIVGAALVVAGEGIAGIVIAVVGVIVLLLGWVGEQRRSEAELPHPPTR